MAENNANVDDGLTMINNGTNTSKNSSIIVKKAYRFVILIIW